MTTIVQDVLKTSHEQEMLTREHINKKNGNRLESRAMEIRNDGKIVRDFEKFKVVVESITPNTLSRFILTYYQHITMYYQIRSQCHKDI